MRARLVRIGNSRGVRLPKPVIEEAGLTEEIELRVREGAVVIMPAAGPRSGWADAAKLMRNRGEDRLIGGVMPTHFDDEEWEW